MHTSQKKPTASIQKKNLKVALVHDYLCEYGGAERVVEALHEIFPDAPVYTAFYDKQALGIHADRFKEWDIKETWINKLPLYKKLFSPYRIFAPKAFESLDLSGYDVVISSTNAYFAKAVTTQAKGRKALHFCYCHTPARSLYGYTTMTDWKRNVFTRSIGTLMNHYLRVVDFTIAQRDFWFIANSFETKRRIAKFYRRDATVIFPPVDVKERTKEEERDLGRQKGEYYLYVGRLAASKHVDLAIRACSQLGLRLKIVGTGKGEQYLRSLAGPSIEFVGSVSDEALHSIYAGTKALLFPAEDEDFGIVPIEAMGHGVPVIAHRSGGPRETIVEGKTGLFFDELTVDSLTSKIQEFEKKAHTFNRLVIYKHARSFRKERFQQEIVKFIRLFAK